MVTASSSTYQSGPAACSGRRGRPQKKEIKHVGDILVPRRVKTVPYPDEAPDFVDFKSVLPEIDLANSNARAMLEVLGLPPTGELVGSLDVHEMNQVLTRLKSFLSSPLERAALLEPIEVNGRVVSTALSSLTMAQMLAEPTRGARTISCGRTDTYLRETAARFVELLTVAKQHSFRVVWS